MLEFGMIGFYRFNGFTEVTRAHLRTHVFSTVILNLDKLVKINYERDAYVWEDIQFNRNAAAPLHAVVSCKCYYFQFGKPQLREGGCAELVARPLDQPLLPPPEQLPALDPSAELTHAQEPEDLKKFLESLDLKDALNNQLALTYLRKMNAAGHYNLDLFIEVWLAAKTGIEGRDALEKGLVAAGVDVSAHHMQMTLAIQKMHERPVQQGCAKKRKTEGREGGGGGGGGSRKVLVSFAKEPFKTKTLFHKTLKLYRVALCSGVWVALHTVCMTDTSWFLMFIVCMSDRICPCMFAHYVRHRL